MEKLASELSAILGLLVVITLVLLRLPRVEVGHTSAFRKRRALNWLPLGFLYAFLYMGRYNLTVAKGVFEGMFGANGEPLMTNADFGTIFGVGATVYGASFLINGPLTDRIGGKAAILLGAAGALVANFLMGMVVHLQLTNGLTTTFTLLYAVNMYFQSFGAAAIVKVNAPWFHVRERGVFGGVFGILISLGIYLAYDGGKIIVSLVPAQGVFFVPAIMLGVVSVIVALTVKNSPAEAGFSDFDTADASSGDDGPPMRVREVFGRMLRSPVIMTIAGIEFCSGFLRQAVMQWFPTYARAFGTAESIYYQHWGMFLCVAGILGAVLAGTISDHLFGSRRGPVVVVLYGCLLLTALGLTQIIGTRFVEPTLVFMSMCVIGVHGMLSGTASMDFGGRRNVGTAVGIIDGFVYAGTGVMALVYGHLLPDKGAGMDAEAWVSWPMAMVPVAFVGLVLARRVWNARPTRLRAQLGHKP